MKYLVTGYKGQLGYDVVRELKKRNVADSDIYPMDINDMDITNRDEVMTKVNEIKPDVIFHNAAWTNVDGAEDMKEACEKVNYLGAKNMADAAKTVGAKIVYISTDYVFDGTKDGMYEIDDKPNPLSVYGKTKYQGEEAVRDYEKHFIVRISWVFGINGKNFIRTMLKLSESRDELNVVADQHGSPTYAKDLAEFIYQAVTKKIPFGIYNATNNGYTTWYDFTKAIFEYTGTVCKVNPVTTEKYIEMMKITQAKRPKNSQMSKEKLMKTGINVPEWEDGLKRYLKEEGRM